MSFILYLEEIALQKITKMFFILFLGSFFAKRKYVISERNCFAKNDNIYVLYSWQKIPGKKFLANKYVT